MQTRPQHRNRAACNSARAAVSRRSVRLILPCVLFTILAGCTGQGVLSPRGPVAAANKTIMLNSLTIMLAIVVPTILAVFAFAWWFRAGNSRAHYDPSFVFSGRVEAIVWGIPLLTIVFLSGLIWMGSHRLDPYRPIASETPPLEVQVVSLDWKWLFIYPHEDVASLNRLVVPVARPLHFSLTSASVMNTFFVPQLGSQIYAMNGMRTELNLLAEQPGVFRGQSSHYSGDGFAKMVFPVEAVAPDEFARWVADAGGAGRRLDAETYSALARQSRDDPPARFGGVAPGLFEAIVQQKIPPAPGPPQGRRADRGVAPVGGR